jgi:hypothetical protein
MLNFHSHQLYIHLKQVILSHYFNEFFYCLQISTILRHCNIPSESIQSALCLLQAKIKPD